MTRIVCRSLALCCLWYLCCPAAAAPAATDAELVAAAPAAPDAELVARLEWPGGLAVRCDIPIGAADLLLCGEAGSDAPLGLTAGLEAPFVRVGELAPSGLLRLAKTPLGFAPGSDVPDEATDLRLDRSPSGSGELSVALVVAPEHLALFWLPRDGGSDTLGCMAGTGRESAIALDGIAAVRDRVPAANGEAWIVECVPSPAGGVLNAAARIGLRRSRWTATVSGGVSASERAPPGWFAVGTAVIGRGDTGIDLLAAGASPEYVGLGDARLPGGARFGVRLRYACPRARVQVRYTMSVDAPGYVPGPFLPSVEDLAFALCRRWPADGGGTWEAGLSLANRIAMDRNGVAVDGPTGTLSAGWRSPRCEAGVTVDVDRDDGATVGAAASVLDPGGTWQAGAEASCSLGGSDPASLSVGGHLRWVGVRGALMLRTGISGLRVGRGAPDGGKPWASLEWRVSDRPGGG